MLLAVSSMTLMGSRAARAATPKALVLADSVTVPGPAPAGSDESLEQYEAEQDGFAVTSVTGEQWAAMTAADFSQYQVIIIGDPTCDYSGDSFAAAAANTSVWEPIVMHSGGNKVLIGSDPSFHAGGSAPNAPKLEANGIAYAGAVPGATGAYIDLSCAYDEVGPSTPVPLLDGLSTHGAAQFTVAGGGFYAACATDVNIVAQTGPTSGLTDADLSEWNCSVHEAFDKFPSDYTPLALAPTASGFPSSYCAIDVETKALACGSPYIMVSGGGVVISSEVTLTPPTQSLSVGGHASVVANVSTTTGPVSAASVVFNVDSGPDAGQTFAGMTDPSGNVTFAYTNGGSAGTDSISATYTSAANVSQKATATVTWTSGAASTSLTTSLSGGGQSGTSISVPARTAVTDTASLSGVNAASATGTVTYNVYSDAACTVLASPADTPIPITKPGTLPASPAYTFLNPGVYYWQASYSGDTFNLASKSVCGGEVETVTAVAASTTLTTSLSGGGKSGTSISVPAQTAVTDKATLSGANAATATGTVTYNVYSDAACTKLARGGTPLTFTAGKVPVSAPVTFSAPGAYYWQASYSGDANNLASKSVCGTSGEVETVTAVAASTSLTTSLSGAKRTGTSITVPAGTAVTDTARLSGANAAKATGTVTYKVYSDAACARLFASAGTVTVRGGLVPNSTAKSLPTPGKYYWTAAYSGDSLNKASASGCRAEIATVTPVAVIKPVIDTVSSGQARNSATANVSTTAAGDLLVAFVAAKAPAGKHQTATVSASGLRWTLVGRDNTGRGDAEVWVARAAGKLHNLRVTAAEQFRGWGVKITVVAYKNATGIGAKATSHASSGAPTGKLRTSKPNSWVFAVGVDWLNGALRTVGAGQVMISQSTDTQHGTYWVQATKSVTPKAGTLVTINDTKPARDPYNMVLVEIR
jgi:hypothetical protein